MPSTPIRILHLEDDPLDAALVEDALRADRLDVSIRRVEDRAGFVAALEGPVDIILSDYNLPAYDALADSSRCAPWRC